MSTKRLTQSLTFSGALPFYLLLIPGFITPDIRFHAFLTYGAIIASFMAGTLWGLTQRDRDPPVLPIVASNILALATWTSLLIPSHLVAIGLQLMIFVGLLEVDRRIDAEGREAPWYFAMRMRITAAVAISYVIQIIVLVNLWSI